jgi:chromosome segregation ATPase
MNNTTPKLPAEVADKIFQEAQDMLAYAPDNKHSYIKGATSYATKLHQLNEDYDKLREEFTLRMKDISELEETIKVLDHDNTRLKGEMEGYKTACDDLTKELSKVDVDQVIAKSLLDEVFRKHESGLLPDRFIYEKIKHFLYGE